MIDIHSHVVWGVDDGPADLGQSLALLEIAARHGTTHMVATPHLNARFSYQAEAVDRRLRELSERSGGTPVLCRGCEFHLNFDNLDALLENPSEFTISGTQYLLVECPESRIGQHTAAVFERLIDAGLVPIVAHPERNPWLRKSPAILAKWVELGCLVQLTALSLTGGFGGGARSASFLFLDRGLIHFIASDCHDAVHRTPRLDVAYHVVESRLGVEAAAALFRDNPRAVLEGRRIAGGRRALSQGASPWFHFWTSAGA